MTVNRTTLLDLPLPVTGTESNTWGDITNNGLTEYMDIAIAGMSNLTSADFTAGALTIETTEGNSAGTSITATSAQYAGFRVSSLAANSTITVGNTGTSPARSYRLINADATYNLTFKATGQTGVTLLPGQSAVVAFNGTDYVIVGTVGAGTATDNAVARFDGTTGEILQNSAATIDDTGAATFVGSVNVSGTSASAADLKLYEDTDNGTNYVAFKSPASVASNVTWTLPSADGTNGQALTTNGSGTLAFSSVTTAPGGSTTQVQYNNAGAFAGSSNLTFDGTNLTSGGTVTATKLIPTGNVTAGNGMYLPTTNTLAFSTDGSERMRILSGGKVLINATTDRDKWDNSTIGSNLLQVERSVSGGNSSISIATNPGTSADVFSLLFLGRSRGTANNDYTAVASGDGLGAISFQGADGTEFVEAASIRGHVDGTPGANDMPGRLVFFTTPDGSATPTERMRIDSSGNVGIGSVPNAYGDTPKLLIYGGASSTSPTIEVSQNGTGVAYHWQMRNGNGIVGWMGSDNTSFVFGTGTSTERMRITSGGNLLVGTATNNASGGVIQVSNGITFPATQSASTDANTLDDYEEGTWTPTIVGSSTAGTATYSTRLGKYTKIGNVVTYQCLVDWNSGTGSGFLRVSGLPFNDAGGSNLCVASILPINVALPASSIAVAFPSSAQSYITISSYPAGGGSDSAVSYDAAGSLYIAGSYFA